MKCRRRQKTVDKASGKVTFKCLNTHCPIYGNEVTDEVCNTCDLQVLNKKPPCQQVLSDEDIDTILSNSDLTEEELTGIPEYPKMPAQIWLYKEALKKWQKAGRPTRTAEEVEHIHKTKCTRCDWYDREKKRCKGCGCKVTSGSIPVINKIKMATEHCPKGEW